jgi:hypothetical protein
MDSEDEFTLTLPPFPAAEFPILSEVGRVLPFALTEQIITGLNIGDSPYDELDSEALHQIVITGTLSAFCEPQVLNLLLLSPLFFGWASNLMPPILRGKLPQYFPSSGKLPRESKPCTF